MPFIAMTSQLASNVYTIYYRIPLSTTTMISSYFLRVLSFFTKNFYTGTHTFEGVFGRQLKTSLAWKCGPHSIKMNDQCHILQ